MVRVVEREGESLYTCEVCGFAYREKDWAEKCQAWCSTHPSCNMKITQHAVERS